jgi:hypothetical protein
MTTHPLRQARSAAILHRAIPKGWYWIAAFGLSISMWWLLLNAMACVTPGFGWVADRAASSIPQRIGIDPKRPVSIETFDCLGIAIRRNHSASENPAGDLRPESHSKP